MFEKFELKRISEKDRIAGYHWGVKDPHHVVVLIHGIGEHAARYDRVASYLTEAGAAVVGMDLRGHGHSMGPKGHCAPRDAIFADIDELIEYAEIRYPGVPVVLYGHSMGGNIVLDYRHRGKYNADLSGYIATSPWLLLKVMKIPEPVITVMRGACRVMPKFFVPTTINQLDLGKLKIVNDKSDPLVHHRISLQTCYDGYYTGKAMAAGTHENNGRARHIPLLLMSGTSDRTCNEEGPRAVAAHEGEACTLVEWDGYYHHIHNGGAKEDGEDAILRMVSFIRSL